MKICDRCSVFSWIDRWQMVGIIGLYDHPRSGRPPTCTEEEQGRVLHYLKAYPKDIKRVVHALEEETTKRVSPKTIKQIATRKPVMAGNGSRKAQPSNPIRTAISNVGS